MGALQTPPLCSFPTSMIAHCATPNATPSARGSSGHGHGSSHGSNATSPVGRRQWDPAMAVLCSWSRSSSILRAGIGGGPPELQQERQLSSPGVEDDLGAKTGEVAWSSSRVGQTARGWGWPDGCCTGVREDNEIDKKKHRGFLVYFYLSNQLLVRVSKHY